MQSVSTIADLFVPEFKTMNSGFADDEDEQQFPPQTSQQAATSANDSTTDNDNSTSANTSMEVDSEKAKRKLEFSVKGNGRKKEWTNVKKAKLCKLQPVYQANISPAQALNDIHPCLIYTFEDEKLLNKTRFICNVTIEMGEDEAKRIFKFSGDGLSKKEAKKNCCLVAMVTLYGDTYKPPKQEPSVAAIDMNSPSDPAAAAKADLLKRMSKIITKETIKFKSPSQMLNELDLKVSETGKELGVKGGEFEYQYTNVHDPNAPESVATGLGRSKKDAKNQAAKQALKKFFDCDLELIAKSE